MKVVRAAGGLVVRATEDGPVLLVVHRPAYDDWSLPKGKLDTGEGDQDAARREVTEETGVDARIIGDAGTVEYEDARGRAKIVRYFVMEPVAHAARAPDAEVDVIEWWPIADAIASLTYAHDRDLVAATLT